MLIVLTCQKFDRFITGENRFLKEEIEVIILFQEVKKDRITVTYSFIYLNSLFYDF